MTAIAAGSGLSRELDDDVLLVTVPRAARMLGISTAQMYNLLARREVASVKIGKSRRLEPAELKRLVAAHRQAAGAGELQEDPAP